MQIDYSNSFFLFLVLLNDLSPESVNVDVHNYLMQRRYGTTTVCGIYISVTCFEIRVVELSTESIFHPHSAA